MCPSQKCTVPILNIIWDKISEQFLINFQIGSHFNNLKNIRINFLLDQSLFALLIVSVEIEIEKQYNKIIMQIKQYGQALRCMMRK